MELATVAVFFQEVCQLVRFEVCVDLLLNRCRRAVCDDVVDFPVQPLQRLRGYFGLDMNTTTEELIAYREKRVAEDRIQYFKDMFTDANLIGFLVDFGFPVNHANALRPEEIAASKEDMKDYIVKSLDRIEWVANDILEQKELLDFDEFARRYEANVRTMIKEKDLIALKSIMTSGVSMGSVPS